MDCKEDKMRKKLFFKLSFLTICAIFISSCFNVATTGAQAVYNRHSLEKNLNDQYITLQAYQALNYKTDEFKNANISIATFNGEVLIAGQVPEAWQRDKAGQIVKDIPNVNEIHNWLDISTPTSTLIRVSDAWITSKIKSKLIASEDVDATTVKVVTEAGVVYLMGTLTPDEANAAVDIAKNTDGVQQVVKIFSYMQVTKAKDDKVMG